MPLFLVQNDITRMRVDAIVNAANKSLLGGGGVDGCIHRAAGPKLLMECCLLGGCKTGSAKITGAGNLPAKHVIHAVGPRYKGGHRGERELLESCYRESLHLAWLAHCRSIAFPLISSGIYGYPKDEALCVALDTIADFLEWHDMDAHVVIFNKANDYRIGEELQHNLESLLTAPTAEQRQSARHQAGESLAAILRGDSGDTPLRRRANLPRERFLALCEGQPATKGEALALAVALGMAPEEAGSLLTAAGHTWDAASPRERIVAYFLARGERRVHRVNAALFAFDEPQLGYPPPCKP